MQERNRTFFKRFILLFAVVLLLLFVAFVFTYGYEEGILRSKAIGEISSYVFVVLSSPLRWVFTEEYSVVGWFVNVFLWALVLTFISNRMLKNKD
jgi:uncharacterized membrane protein (DUF485 family)